MSSKVQVLLIDDLDGTTQGAETVSFGLDGTAYEIDLTTAHAREFREMARHFAQAGRKVRQRRNGTYRNARDRERSQAVRAWARQAGRKIPARGRIPAAVLAAFDRSQRGSQMAREPRIVKDTKHQTVPPSGTGTVTALPTASSGRTAAEPALTAAERAELRKLAAKRGRRIAPRGRIPADVIADYRSWPAKQARKPGTGTSGNGR